MVIVTVGEFATEKNNNKCKCCSIKLIAIWPTIIRLRRITKLVDDRDD